MAKITTHSRELLNDSCNPYKTEIESLLEKEKNILKLIEQDDTGAAYKRMMLVEDMIFIATIYMTMNNLSVEILETKNTDALNEARKVLYKAVIYLEEIVTNIVDAPYSEYQENVARIINIPLDKRYFIVRKLGLAIRLLMDAYGENTKWKWAFVELNGRFAVTAKNMIDMKAVSKSYFDPQHAEHDTTVYYVRLVRRMLEQSADQYRDKYELATRRIDDMRNAILFVAAQRRFCIILNETEEADELKKKGQVWKDKLENDRKKGIAR